MSNKNVKVQNSGAVENQVEMSQFAVEEFDDNIRSSRVSKGKSLTANVQKVFDRLQAAIDYANANNGKAQISLPHSEFPTKGKMANTDITNAINSGKRKFSNISFSLIVDAINKDGQKLNASVVRVSLKSEENN